MGEDWTVDVGRLVGSADTLNHPLQVATDGFDCNLKTHITLGFFSITFFSKDKKKACWPEGENHELFLTARLFLLIKWQFN